MFRVVFGAVEHMEKDWGHLAKSIRKEPGNDELSAKAARYIFFLLLFMNYIIFI